MRVLVACERSGIVRDAFKALGHDAWSCDLVGSDAPGQHLKCDAREILSRRWDLLIAHPPCTRICNSGVRWLAERNLWADMRAGCEFFLAMLNAPIQLRAIENPIPHKHAMEIIKEPYSQLIQPYEFGHPETKATCLWLRGLPPLMSTMFMQGRKHRIHAMSPGPERERERSKTFSGIAEAMASQWTF